MTIPTVCTYVDLMDTSYDRTQCGARAARWFTSKHANSIAFGARCECHSAPLAKSRMHLAIFDTLDDAVAYQVMREL